MQGYVVREQLFHGNISLRTDFLCQPITDRRKGRLEDYSSLPWGLGDGSAKAGEVKLAEVAIVVEVNATVVLGVNTGSPAREAACGKIPRDVDAPPVRDKPTIA